MTTIMERIASCSDGSVILFDSDVTEAIEITGGRKITLDLNGHTLTGPEGTTPLTVNGGTVIIGNGTVMSDTAIPIRVGVKGATERSYITLNPDLKVRSATMAGVFVAAKAEVVTYADIVVNGEYAAIQGNGTEPYFDNTVTVYGGRCIANTTGIYWPQVGDLRIMGGEIQAATGIEIRAGTLTVQGGTITGTGVPTNILPNGNGSTSEGCGIAVAQHTTKKAIDLIVNGGTINGYSAIYESNPQGNPAEDISQVKLALNKGTFNAINGGTVAVYSQDCTGFVRGGTYNTPVAREMCVEGFEVLATLDGTYAIRTVMWEAPDGGVAGGGFLNLRRLILAKDRFDYQAGGIELPAAGFAPYAVLSVTARGGGLTAYYDESVNRVILYRNGAEATGTIEDLKIIMIGH